MKDCKRDVLKSAFHNWLSTIPDELHIPGNTAIQRVESNSICHMKSALRESKPVPTNSS